MFTESRGCTAAQLALAWVHAQGNDVFPIPGTKSVTRLLEVSAGPNPVPHFISMRKFRSFTCSPSPTCPHQNVSAAAIKLSREEEQQLRGSVQVLQGERYPADAQGSTFNTRA